MNQIKCPNCGKMVNPTCDGRRRLNHCGDCKINFDDSYSHIFDVKIVNPTICDRCGQEAETDLMAKHNGYKVCPECAMGIVRNHVETKFFDKEAPTIEVRYKIANS
jgi:hypothetical protein